ncbi:MAG: 30S ribosomal protein S9 [Parcubacteria group bacterium]|nr:30S ribosomal protein S9 [Parcubacteria group bacterium]
MKKPDKKQRYYEAVGRRKTAVARVRLYGKAGGFLVNKKPLNEYFKTERQRNDAVAPVSELKLSNISFTVKVKGGGLTAQSQAVRHGLARAFVVQNPVFKKRLRKLGFLTRDPRMVERKKYGLKKARRAPQWAKR